MVGTGTEARQIAAEKPRSTMKAHRGSTSGSQMHSGKNYKTTGTEAKVHEKEHGLAGDKSGHLGKGTAAVGKFGTEAKPGGTTKAKEHTHTPGHMPAERDYTGHGGAYGTKGQYKPAEYHEGRLGKSQTLGTLKKIDIKR